MFLRFLAVNVGSGGSCGLSIKPFSLIRIAPMVIDELPRGVNFFLKFLRGS